MVVSREFLLPRLNERTLQINATSHSGASRKPTKQKEKAQPREELRQETVTGRTRAVQGLDSVVHSAAAVVGITGRLFYHFISFIALKQRMFFIF
jgi:hypothetical protein